MTNLTTIQTNIDKKIYNFFTENVNFLTPISLPYGQYLTDALDIYLDIIEAQPNEMDMKQPFNKPTTPIYVEKVNPKTHQKFRKYIKRKYRQQNFQYHYSQELNLVIATYILCIQWPSILHCLQELNEEDKNKIEYDIVRDSIQKELDNAYEEMGMSIV